MNAEKLSHRLNTYIGEWELVPELCLYEEGEPPSSGLYTITEFNDEVSVTIEWVDSEGVEHSIQYGGPVDGSKQPIDSPGVTHMSLTRVSPSILDSAAFDGTQEVMYARRAAQDNLLSTVQRIKREVGPYSIFQVYRRRANAKHPQGVPHA